jgi:hypothetical protein
VIRYRNSSSDVVVFVVRFRLFIHQLCVRPDLIYYFVASAATDVNLSEHELTITERLESGPPNLDRVHEAIYTQDHSSSGAR